jgi:L-fucono-1,5-lactonase
VKVDAHQHFWHYDPSEYGWIGAEMSCLMRDFLPGDLAREQLPIGFDGSIVVQARQSLGETEWLLQLAETSPRLLGVVGWLDLCSEALPAQLEQCASHPKLRGVRHVVQDEPDDAFLLRDDFINGVAQLREYGFTYDILIFPRHLPAACAFVSRLPDQPFALDHLAKPSIKDGIVEPWAGDLRKLAAFPNVQCKLSGMVTEADWHQWRPEHLLPYLEVALEAFGPERLMIGSDWPVCTVAGSYREVIGVVVECIGTLSTREQALILGENAVRFYGVKQ